MLKISNKDIDNFDYKSGKFMAAYDFLKTKDLGSMEDGSVELEFGVTVIVQRYITAPFEDCKFEAHDRYFDIQYLVKGREKFGVADRAKLVVKTEYDAENDFVLFEDPADCSLIELNEGELVIVSPEEAHKPRCSVGENGESVIKIVIKVPV